MWWRKYLNRKSLVDCVDWPPTYYTAQLIINSSLAHPCENSWAHCSCWRDGQLTLPSTRTLFFSRFSTASSSSSWPPSPLIIRLSPLLLFSFAYFCTGIIASAMSYCLEIIFIFFARFFSSFSFLISTPNSCSIFLLLQASTEKKVRNYKIWVVQKKKRVAIKQRGSTTITRL